MQLVKYFLAFLPMLLALNYSTLAQDQKCLWKTANTHNVVVLADTLSLIPASIKVKDALGNIRPHKYNFNSGNIILLDKIEMENDSLFICYKTLPFSLKHVFQNRSLEKDYDSLAFFKDKEPERTAIYDFREEVFTSSKLNQSGNLTRGISFGNTQNVFVNSALNLQMDGELAENLNIRASITDQNVPFQPEGNTQQIQDFDNILIELYNDKINLAGGDVVLQQRKSEFLRYYKNVQGLQFTSDNTLNEKWKASSRVGAAIAKGKFASMNLEVTEGVLGPYRISGPGNERYVIVLANSEKVFLDGKQLKRGFNNDYTIDYNQGEITFTPTVLITQYSRVRVDFEYAERNFSRSIITANHIQENKNVTFYLNYYREKDDRNRPLFTELSDGDKRLLSSVGDDILSAAIPRVDSVAFDSNRILYKKVSDFSENGETVNYYAYSTDPAQAFYAISFTETTQGLGDYIRKEQLANGVVYEFIAPINGVSQGNFTISSPLPAPNKKQMMTAGTEVRLGDYETTFVEVALSDQDENLFSDLGDADNKGYAIKAGLRSEGRSVKMLKDYLFNGQTTVEYNSTNFSFVDRLRFVEFDRDWGLTNADDVDNVAEKLFNVSLELLKNNQNQFSYSLDLRNRTGVLSGLQQRIKLNQKIWDRLLVTNDFFQLKSEVHPLQSDWLRYQGEIKYPTPILVPGYRYILDKNKVTNPQQNQVVSTAMNYEGHEFFINSNDSLNYSFVGTASFREDKAVMEGQLKPDTKAFMTSYGVEGTFGAHTINGSFTYRKLIFLTEDLPEETTVMGKLNYRSSLFDNNLSNEYTYALGNGRELRREFVYLPVPTGEGTHTWRDDDEDGVQQLNEFYLAINPEEKNYIKVFVPTDEYLQAYTTLFNYRLSGKFPSKWKTLTGVKKWLAKFSNNTNLNVEKKITSRDFFQRISPFQGGVAEESLLSLRQSFRSSFFFNRSSPKFGMDFSFFNSHQKQLLTGGFEDVSQDDWRYNARYNIETKWNLMFYANRGKRNASSDFLDNRNFRIEQFTYGPEISLQPSPFFRSTLQYRLTNKENLANVEIEEAAQIHEGLLSFRVAKAIKTTVNAQLKYTYISYNGLVNSPTGYEMLQALSPGNNTSWSLNWLHKIGEGLQLNLMYEGRKSEGLDHLVHTGRMQVSALF